MPEDEWAARGYFGGGGGYLGGTPLHLKHAMSDLLHATFHPEDANAHLLHRSADLKGAMFDVFRETVPIFAEVLHVLAGTFRLRARRLFLKHPTFHVRSRMGEVGGGGDREINEIDR